MTTETNEQPLSFSIRHLLPSSDLVEWLDAQVTLEEAWRDCARADWMLWLLGTQIASACWSEDRKPLLGCCLDCAEVIQHLWKKEHVQVLTEVIQILRDWINNRATVSSVLEAKADVYAITRTNDPYDAANVVNLAANVAASSDYVAGYASLTGLYASLSAGHNSPSFFNVRDETSARCADIVRRYFPRFPEISPP